MSPVTFGIVGGGWRTRFFLRVARELPERFRVSGVVVRDEEKGQRMEAEWNVTTYRNLDALLHAGQVDFVVVSVPRAVTPPMLQALAERGIPALAETPPAPDLEGLNALHELTEQGQRFRSQNSTSFNRCTPHGSRLLPLASWGWLLRRVSQWRMAIMESVSYVRCSVSRGSCRP